MEKIKVGLSVGHYRKDGVDPSKTAGVYNKEFDLYEHDICDHIVNIAHIRLGSSKSIRPYKIANDTLPNKVKYINEADCDIAVEVHLNFYGGAHSDKVTGIETVYEDGEKESKILANMIQGQLVLDLKDRDRGILSDNEVQHFRGWNQFYFFDKLEGSSFLRDIPTITALTEIGFLSNPIFAKKCSNWEVQPIAGNAIAIAIESFVKNMMSISSIDNNSEGV